MLFFFFFFNNRLPITAGTIVCKSRRVLDARLGNKGKYTNINRWVDR